MTEETLKHELYKHGSYLHSLKESGSEFVNIDNEIQKLEELFQLASKKDHQPDLNIKNNNNNPTLWSQIMTDHHPEFAVEKYYRVCGTTKLTYEVTPNDVTEKQETKFYVDHEDRFVKMNLSKKAIERDEPATAEQIATFKRAEQFAAKGRKLDEFRVGDMCKTVDGYMHTIGTDYIAKVSKDESATLIQTAEELQEVENNE